MNHTPNIFQYLARRKITNEEVATDSKEHGCDNIQKKDQEYKELPVLVCNINDLGLWGPDSRKVDLLKAQV